MRLAMSRAPHLPPAPPGPDAGRGGEGAPFRLRLAVSRQGVGLEIDGPAPIGPLRVDELVWALPSVRLPADLSGGVSAFRHRRGRLLRASISGSAEELVRWAQTRLLEAPLVGRASHPALAIAPVEGGIGLCLASDEHALAWNLAWLPFGRDVRLVAYGARGLGLALPAHALALQASAALLREGAVTRRGSSFTLNDPVSRLIRYLLPWVGARVPGTEGLVWSSLGGGGRWVVAASERGLEPSPPASAALALEVALLLAPADDALAEGRWDEARQGYLRALEQAPHQPEVAARLADLDRSLGRHAELAFATLEGAGALGGASLLEGELRLACGDRDGAGVVFEAAAGAEPHAALAALALAAAAELADDEGQASALLAAAVARAPTHLGVREKRLAWALRAGDLRAALAEAERLVAATELGARHGRLLAVGRAFAAAGRGAEALGFFEQALRLRPEAPEALWALGQALAERGQNGRAVELLRRASEGAERAGLPLYGAHVALARALGDGLGDLSTAVARLRQVPAGVEQAAEARWLEGWYLARLGEGAEASIAFARMRDALGHAPPEGGAVSEQAAARLAWAEAFEASAWSDANPTLPPAPEGERAPPAPEGKGRVFRAEREGGAAGPDAGELREPGALVPRAYDDAPGGEGAFAYDDAPAGEGAPTGEGAPADGDAPAYEGGTESDEAPAYDGATESDEAPAYEGGTESDEAPAYEGGTESDEAPAYDGATESDEAPAYDGATEGGDPADDDATFSSSPGEAEPSGAGDDAPSGAGGGEAPAGAAEGELGGRAGAWSPADGWERDDEPARAGPRPPPVDEELLTARVRANPDDIGAVEALADLLEAGDRDAELFALLSARIDEGDDRTRQALAPRQRAVLARLARDARAAGRPAEAELYELSLGALGG